ncbi:AMP-binding protein, partial [Granulicella sp. L60]|uniref:AMP-binding protein n=1 Tax=Granulicella sp. L60 TaxID=1641866 RepID=UPI0020B14C70
GLLAVLKAGGAYVPLDPSYPVERLRFMLEDSGPVALLTQAALLKLFEDLQLPMAELDDENAAWRNQPDSNPDPHSIGLNSSHLAYIIYTSGSTGTPKGVMVEHRGLCNLVTAQIREFAVATYSQILQFASFSFDACVWETMMALCRGASLHLLRQERMSDGDALTEIVAHHAITHATLPPAVLASLSEQVAFDSIRTLVCAGEELTGSVARRWRQGRQLINAYGPTEATICATIHSCRAEEFGNPPIGRPIGNTQVYILDAHGEPVP